MPELIYMKGLPGSGKTTLARTKYPNHYRVNKDDIRAMLYGDEKWTRERERNVVDIERTTANVIVQEGKHNVVIDNTGFSGVHEEYYTKIAKLFKYDFKIEDLSSVPLHECLTRNAQRTGKARVPDKVIHDMWKKYVQPKLAYPQDPNLTPCIIVDVDGTVAEMVGRGPFEWDKVGTDKPREEVITAIKAYAKELDDSYIPVIFFSGRKYCCYRQTKEWLIANFFGKDPEDYRYEDGTENENWLHMRFDDDDRPDYIVKEELWKTFVKDNYRVVAVFDDRPSVLRLWRKLGFTTFDVGPGVEF